MIERRADERENIWTVIDEALVCDFPGAPIAARIGRRDRSSAVRHGIRRIGNILAKLLARRRIRRRKRQRSIRVEIKIGTLGFFRGPCRIRVPAIGSALKCAGLPLRLFALIVQVVAEEWRFDVLAEFARGFVPTERNHPDAVAPGCLPLPVVPRTRHNKVGVLRVALFRMTENLPRSPGIFLIPESGNIEIGNGRGMKLPHPSFLFPELIVVRVIDGGIPVRNRAAQIFGINV